MRRRVPNSKPIPSRRPYGRSTCVGIAEQHEFPSFAAFCSKGGQRWRHSQPHCVRLIMSAIVTKLQAAPDPFDPENLRLDQSFVETSGVKKLLTTVPVRKPNNQDFVRVHPD